MTRQPLPAAVTPILAWAQWYAAHLGPVFPCFGKAPYHTTRRRRQCPPECPGGANGHLDATRDLAIIEAWWTAHPGANIGLALPPGLIGVDIDGRNGGVETLALLEQTYTELPRTVTNLTGSGQGSMHLLYLVPEGLTCTGKLGKGIDVKQHGGYLIMPPSIHPDTSQRYVWESDYSPEDIDPQPAPDWLMALLMQAGGNGHAASGEDSPAPDGPIYEGTRETTLMSLGGTLLHGGGTAAEIHAALSDNNAARCIPPLERRDIDRMVSSLFKTDARHKAEKAAQKEAAAQLIVTKVQKQANGASIGTVTVPITWPQSRAFYAMNDQEAPEAHVPIAPVGWRETLFMKRTKTDVELHANSYNMMQLLRYADFWQQPANSLWLDVLTGRHMWGEEQIMPGTLVKISEWFGYAERMPISKSGLSLLEDCLFERCERNPRDRIALWLHGLPPWDQTPRLATWLSDIAGAARDDYTSHLGRRLLVSMVARAVRPGCQYREVLVFGGPENIGKSHIVETLASKEFFIVLSMNLEAKEAHMMLRQAWLAELADLDSMNRTEDARMKAFITMEEDTYIPKYRNDSVSVPRRAIFVGTTNDRAYLKSLSGNTRFLPLWLPGPVDLAALRAMRDQLFAEAIHAYHEAAEGWWHMPHEIQEEARVRREQARVKSEYEGPLADWLDTTTDPSKTCWQDIARHFLLIESPERWKDRSLQLQITGALRALGYVPHSYRHKGTLKKVDGWIKKTPEVVAEEEESETWNF